MTITTVAANDRVSGPYTASAAQTVFPYDFPIYDDGDLHVVRIRASVQTTLALSTDYTVTGVEDPAGGTIVLTTGSTASDEITITGAMPRVRAAYFQDGGDFVADDINRDFNRTLMMLQEQDVRIDEATALAELSVSQEDMDAAIAAILGDVTAQAEAAETNATAAADSAAAAQVTLEAILSGGALASAPVSAAMQPVVASATTALARTAMGMGTAAAAATGDFMAAGTGALKSANLSDLANAGTARTNLGLGTLAVASAGSGLEINAGAARLTDTAVTAGTYGDAETALQITVDAKGRLTDVTEVPIGGTAAFRSISSSASTSAAAAVDFAIPSGYSKLRFDIRDMAPASSATLRLRFSTDGGATYIATNDYAWQNHNFGSSGNNSASSSAITLMEANQATTEKAFGWVEIDVAEKMLLSMLRYAANEAAHATGVCGAAGTPTHVRFLYSTGNVARHNIKLSGMI